MHHAVLVPAQLQKGQQDSGRFWGRRPSSIHLRLQVVDVRVYPGFFAEKWRPKARAAPSAPPGPRSLSGPLQTTAGRPKGSSPRPVPRRAGLESTAQGESPQHVQRQRQTQAREQNEGHVPQERTQTRRTTKRRTYVRHRAYCVGHRSVRHRRGAKCRAVRWCHSGRKEALAREGRPPGCTTVAPHKFQSGKRRRSLELRSFRISTTNLLVVGSLGSLRETLPRPTIIRLQESEKEIGRQAQGQLEGVFA